LDKGTSRSRSLPQNIVVILHAHQKLCMKCCPKLANIMITRKQPQNHKIIYRQRGDTHRGDTHRLMYTCRTQLHLHATYVHTQAHHPYTRHPLSSRLRYPITDRTHVTSMHLSAAIECVSTRCRVLYSVIHELALHTRVTYGAFNCAQHMQTTLCTVPLYYATACSTWIIHPWQQR